MHIIFWLRPAHENKINKLKDLNIGNSVKIQIWIKLLLKKKINIRLYSISRSNFVFIKSIKQLFSMNLKCLSWKYTHILKKSNWGSTKLLILRYLRRIKQNNFSVSSKIRNGELFSFRALQFFKDTFPSLECILSFLQI